MRKGAGAVKRQPLQHKFSGKRSGQNEIEFTQNEYDPAVATAGTWNWTFTIPSLDW